MNSPLDCSRRAELRAEAILDSSKLLFRPSSQAAICSLRVFGAASARSSAAQRGLSEHGGGAGCSQADKPNVNLAERPNRRIRRGAHQEQPISAAREQTPPHAPERTGQLNSRHSHESQPEQSSLVRRVPKPAVVVVMAAAAIIFLVIVVVVIVSTLTICFFGARPIETILGAFGFLAVDQS